MYEGPERTAIAAASLSWKTLTKLERAAAYLSATFDSPPRIRKENKAYEPARRLELISEDGRMHELVFRGLEVAVLQDQAEAE